MGDIHRIHPADVAYALDHMGMLDACLTLLRQIEWSGARDWAYPDLRIPGECPGCNRCPCCEGHQPGGENGNGCGVAADTLGHAHECTLAALIDAPRRAED